MEYQYPALVTLLLILQYIVFMGLVGKERVAHKVMAPAVTGHQDFERAYRVHVNTMEQLVITLPSLWLCALFFSANVAAALGLLFFLGRILYRNGYVKDPEKRGIGMGVGFLGNLGLLGCALWGVIGAM